MQHHYSRNDLTKALQRLPLERGDTVFIHSNIGYFGRLEGVQSVHQICEVFLNTLTNILGNFGTIVVPTFTYSFPRKEVFDPDFSYSNMGVFSEWIRLQDNVYRSVDPSYSVAAIGRGAESLTSNMPENSFAEDGFFGRFLKCNGVILNLNFDAGSTFLHFLERELNVPYRFDKTFEGIISQSGIKRVAKNTIYVRYASSEKTEPSFEEFHKLAVSRNFFCRENLGRGSVGAIRASDSKKLLESIMPSRPYILTKADGIDAPLFFSPEKTYQGL